MDQFLKYVLARAQERSTVAGVVGFVVAAFSLQVEAGTLGMVVNLVIMGAGLIAAAMPGGK
jgi:hypothetical protein